jgi:hypothetical protein
LKKNITLLAALTATLFTSSCIIAINEDGATWRGPGFANWGPDTHRGSGIHAEEIRETESFTGVQLIGAFDMQVEVGPELAIEIHGDDNLLQFVRTQIQDGSLIVDLQEGEYSWNGKLVVYVKAPTIEQAHLLGSGSLLIDGPRAKELTVSLTGSGDMAVMNAEVDQMYVELAGSGDMSLTGHSQSLQVKLSGSGDIEAASLAAVQTRASLAGSGEIRVNAQELLDVRISGSGEVGYSGSPKLSKSIAGSGEVYSFK